MELAPDLKASSVKAQDDHSSIELAKAALPVGIERPLLATEFTHGYRDEQGATHTSTARVQVTRHPENKDQLCVTVESPTGDKVHPRTALTGVMGALGRLAAGVAIFTAAERLSTERAEAGLMLPGASKDVAHDIAESQAGIRLNLFTGPKSDGSIAVASAASVFAYSESTGIGMVATSLHIFTNTGTNPLDAQIGSGENFNNDLTKVGIFDYVTMPEADLALLFYRTELVGAQTVALASAPIGTWVTHAGNSGFRTVGGELIRDGLGYGWTAPVIAGTSGGYSDTYFNRSYFNSAFGELMNGRGMPGDSGSPVTFMLDSQTYLAGITSGGSTLEAPFGYSNFTDLNFTTASWMNQEYAARIVPGSVPEPGTLTLMATGLGIAAGAYALSRKKGA